MPSPLFTEPPRQRPSTPKTRWSRWFWLSLWGLMAAGLYGVYSNTLQIPARLNPWAPLKVAETPNFLTGYKLSRARSNPVLCSSALSQTEMQYDMLPDRVTGPGCGFENAVRLRMADVRIGSPISLSCPMALSFFMWEQHALQPAAKLHFGQRVAAIEHLGSYACRNINRGEGTPSNAMVSSRSRHATANALDIAAITLANGRRISVLKQWHDDAATTPDLDALMLTDAHRGACRFFDGVLGPDYNALHRDHFHLETGGYSMCR